MPIIVDPTQFNPSALTVPSVYLVVEPPQASITGAPASVFGKVGTASWGQVNQALIVGSLQEQNINFGGMSAASLTDVHDLATSVWATFQQASSPQGLTVQGVRVTDGTDVAASLALVDNQGNTTGLVVGGTKTTADVINLVFTNSNISGSPVTVTYTVLSGDTLTTIAVALKNAINANAALAAAGITASNPSSAHINVVSNDLDIIPTITYAMGGNSESITISPGTAVAGGTLNALYTGILGNAIRFSILPGTSSGLVNVLLTAWPGKSQEYYPALPNSSSFWAALQSALSGGAGPTIPASNLARFTPAGSGSPQAPQQLIASPLAGGTDGRGVASGDLVGNPTGGVSGQGSGLYALLPAKPFCQQAACVGLTDMVVAPAIQEFAFQNGIAMFIQQAIDTTPSDAVTALNTYGIDNYQVICFIDWCKMFDPVNNVSRYISPDGPLGGLVAALAPQNSPLNKQLQGVITTSRLANIGPYSNSEVGLANTNGLSLVSNPIGQGPTFGFVTGVNTSLNNQGTAPVEYTRMTNFIIQSVGAALGVYLGANQLAQPFDPVRAAIKQELNSFFVSLEGNDQLNAHQVLCEFQASGSPSPGYNTPQTIGQHICSVFVAAQYVASIWYLIFTLQGGTTVSVQNVVSPQPAQ